MDIKDKIASATGGFEKLVGKIPGYKGYKQKELRREADKLLRVTIARQLDDQRGRLSALQIQLIGKRRLDLLDDLDRAVGKTAILSDRLKTSTYGYAGLFDAVKVKEGELDALYNYDSALLDTVTQISARVDAVGTAIDEDGDIMGAINGLVGVLRSMNTTLDHRQEVLLQGASELPAKSV